MIDELIGREQEVNSLMELYHSSASHMVAILGRRRVGKTFLIHKTFPSADFSYVAFHGATKAEQIDLFLTKLNKYENKSEPHTATSWIEAFAHLQNYLESKRKTSKKVVVLDELPWMDSDKSKFVESLGYFWNEYASKNNVLLIICGSAASWMIKKIANNRGGLHNRVTAKINVFPFTLKQTELYLKKRGCAFEKAAIAQLYMVFGGIPYYLSLIKKGESVAQAIDRICFEPGAPLIGEFENLYAALFKNHQLHITIIETLAKQNLGITRAKLIEKSGLTDGGTITNALAELEVSGFIQIAAPFGKGKKEAIFRLCDNFSIFYLTFIKRKSNLKKGAFTALANSTKWSSWCGYAFENLCFAHVPAIEKKLGITGVYSTIHSFYFKGNEEMNGTQIDLIIDRADQIVNVCELKFYNAQYVISKDYGLKLRNKMNVLKQVTKTRKSIYLTMITSFGLSKNIYSSELIQNEITLEDLFQ